MRDVDGSPVGGLGRLVARGFGTSPPVGCALGLRRFLGAGCPSSDGPSPTPPAVRRAAAVSSSAASIPTRPASGGPVLRRPCVPAPCGPGVRRPGVRRPGVRRPWSAACSRPTARYGTRHQEAGLRQAGLRQARPEQAGLRLPEQARPPSRRRPPPRRPPSSATCSCTASSSPAGSLISPFLAGRLSDRPASRGRRRSAPTQPVRRRRPLRPGPAGGSGVGAGDAGVAVRASRDWSARDQRARNQQVTDQRATDQQATDQQATDQQARPGVRTAGPVSAAWLSAGRVCRWVSARWIPAGRVRGGALSRAGMVSTTVRAGCTALGWVAGPATAGGGARVRGSRMSSPDRVDLPVSGRAVPFGAGTAEAAPANAVAGGPRAGGGRSGRDSFRCGAVVTSTAAASAAAARARRNCRSIDRSRLNASSRRAQGEPPRSRRRVCGGCASRSRGPRRRRPPRPAGPAWLSQE